jgi:hypothetical protein
MPLSGIGHDLLKGFGPIYPHWLYLPRRRPRRRGFFLLFITSALFLFTNLTRVLPYINRSLKSGRMLMSGAGIAITAAAVLAGASVDSAVAQTATAAQPETGAQGREERGDFEECRRRHVRRSGKRGAGRGRAGPGIVAWPCCQHGRTRPGKSFRDRRRRRRGSDYLCARLLQQLEQRDYDDPSLESLRAKTNHHGQPQSWPPVASVCERNDSLAASTRRR